MTWSLETKTSLRRLFDGLVEQVFFTDIGLCDTVVTDYLGSLLTEFVHMDRICCLRAVDGAVIRDVARMEADAVLHPDVDETQRRRIINRYIGDFTLFWAGVYPEQLHPRRNHGVGLLEPYVVQGKTSYGIASELTGADDEPPADVLRRLSLGFEWCVHGLHLVRNEWERLGRNPPKN